MAKCRDGDLSSPGVLEWHLESSPDSPQQNPKNPTDGSGAAAPGNSRMESSLDHGESVGKSAKQAAHPALSHNPLLEKGEKGWDI